MDLFYAFSRNESCHLKCSLVTYWSVFIWNTFAPSAVGKHKQSEVEEGGVGQLLAELGVRVGLALRAIVQGT